MLRIVSTTPTLSAFQEAQDGSSDIDLLHAISVDLIAEQDRMALYGKIVDAAIAITRSQFGTMQLKRQPSDGGAPGLHLLVSRGLTAEDRAVWQWVDPAAHSSCTAALKSGRRVVIADYELWDEIRGTRDLEAFRRAGIRSAQTTPLVSRDGTLLGMISTHWDEPHEPSRRDLRLLDILARQAADLLDRMIAEEALRDREQELEKTVAALRKNEELQKVLNDELGHRVKNLFAVVAAITSYTLRGSSDQSRSRTLQDRLMALSSAHDILLQSSWKPALLKDVAVAAMANAGIRDRIGIDGPDVALGSKAALNLALILHELATNALKYGSLSLGAGFVDLSWRIGGEPASETLYLSWKETRGPIVRKPTGSGFGSRLIGAGIAGSGNVVLSYKTTGLECEMSAPLNELGGSE
ncbi:HWE histidine kinase domain-containing protein [Azospirillum endophyticum]|nr:HWE histidine kinase domain-containing protein [Azospirillum endophyticum]